MPAERRVLALVQRWLNSSGEDEHQGLNELLDRLRLAINTVSTIGLVDFAVTPTFNGGTVLTNPLTTSLQFSPDATLDIGSGGLRPRDVTLSRALVAGTSVTATTAMNAASATITGQLTIGSGSVLPFDSTGKIQAISSTYFASLSGANLTNLPAANLTGGPIPAMSGVNLTALNADNVASGTLAVARTHPCLYKPITLTDGATPALDASLGKVFLLVAAGDRTIGIPSNPQFDGQTMIIKHTASGGARTLALNSGTGGFLFGSDLTALTQTASGKTDVIGCVYDLTANKWWVVSVMKGY